MKRYSVIKSFTGLLKDSDIAIFSGKDMCVEAYQYDKPGYFYINDTFGVSLSFALGVALSTDKRVFIFVGEGDLLRELAVIGQVAVSKCKNMFVIILDNGVYQSAGNHPNIFSSFMSKKGFIYNLGCLVHDFTFHFKNKYFVEVKSAVDRIRGPMIILIDVDKGIKKGLTGSKMTPIKQKNKFMKFVQNKELRTELFTPPGIIATLKDEKIKSISMKNSGGIN
jgi:hypothetical protein